MGACTELSRGGLQYSASSANTCFGNLRTRFGQVQGPS